MNIRPGSRWESHNRGHAPLIVVVRHATINYVRAFPVSRRVGGVPDRSLRFRRDEFLHKFRPLDSRRDK